MTAENTTNSRDIIISYLTLRKTIGWLGMLLPFILVIGNFSIVQLNILNNSFFVDSQCSDPYIADGFFKRTISHYYYSSVSVLLTGILIAVGLFLLSYKGHKKRPGEKGLSDNALTHLAGVSALAVAIFPTGSSTCVQDNIYVFLATKTVGNIHFLSAAVFFISLSLICIINFRRTEDVVSFGKKRFHGLYLFCGIGMLSCISLVFIYGKWIKGHFIWLDNLHPIFCLEAIALVFFGISWLTKGKVDFTYIPKKLRLHKKKV